MRDISTAPALRQTALALAPALFVFLWSTGWISARAAAIDCDPLTFLAARFFTALLVFALLALIMRAPRPASVGAAIHAMVSGLLLHAIYLGGVWWAIGEGLPAGISGVVAGTQPILTALLAPYLLNERISTKQWGGIGLGFIGILIVLAPKLAVTQHTDLSRLHWALAINMVGMVAVTLGTFYQKRFIPSGDLRTTALWQYVGAFPATLLAAWLFEPNMKFTVSWTSIATMLWSVLAISLGAILLLLWLIRNGAVSRAASLIYLVPSATAFEAWLLFGESLQSLQLVGIAIAMVGVAFATQKA